MTGMDRFPAPEEDPYGECDPFDGRPFSPITLALGDAAPAQLNVVGLLPEEILAHGTLTLELGLAGNVYEACWVPYPTPPRRKPSIQAVASTEEAGR